MLRRALMILVPLALAAVAFYFLLHRPQQQALEAARHEAQRRAQEFAALQLKLADLESIKEELQKSSEQLAAAVRRKEEELAGLRVTHEELVAGLEQEIAEGNIRVERMRDQLRLEMVDEILFDSGQASLKSEGVAILGKVGEAPKKSDRLIEILLVPLPAETVPAEGAPRG